MRFEFLPINRARLWDSRYQVNLNNASSQALECHPLPKTRALLYPYTILPPSLTPTVCLPIAQAGLNKAYADNQDTAATVVSLPVKTPKNFRALTVCNGFPFYASRNSLPLHEQVSSERYKSFMTESPYLPYLPDSNISRASSYRRHMLVEYTLVHTSRVFSLLKSTHIIDFKLSSQWKKRPCSALPCTIPFPMIISSPALASQHPSIRKARPYGTRILEDGEAFSSNQLLRPPRLNASLGALIRMSASSGPLSQPDEFVLIRFSAPLRCFELGVAVRPSGP